MESLRFVWKRTKTRLSPFMKAPYSVAQNLLAPIALARFLHIGNYSHSKLIFKSIYKILTTLAQGQARSGSAMIL